jgi:hypothetical protein
MIAHLVGHVMAIYADCPRAVNGDNRPPDLFPGKVILPG